MSEDTTEGSGGRETKLSRRAALRAGVGVGVGLAAWSGPTITSVGATPTYAAGCTFVIQIDLLDPACRNTDQRSNCTDDKLFGYHQLKTTGLPTGYSIQNNIPEGECCSSNWAPELHFPKGMTCKADILISGPAQCTAALRFQLTSGPVEAGPDGGVLSIEHSCPDPNSYSTSSKLIPANSQYRVLATCTTTGAAQECLDD